MEYKEIVSKALNLCAEFVMNEKYSVSIMNTNFHSSFNPEQMNCGVTIHVHKNIDSGIVRDYNIRSYCDEAENIEQLNEFEKFVNSKIR